MNKLAKLIADGQITVEELASAKELIERAELVTKGIAACKKTILFPLGEKEVDCYYYTDCAGEYQAWGNCNVDSVFTCYSNWGGNCIIGRCNLTDFQEVFMGFEDDRFAADLHRFLNQQITKVENM